MLGSSFEPAAHWHPRMLFRESSSEAWAPYPLAVGDNRIRTNVLSHRNEPLACQTSGTALDKDHDMLMLTCLATPTADSKSVRLSSRVGSQSGLSLPIRVVATACEPIRMVEDKAALARWPKVFFSASKWYHCRKVSSFRNGFQSSQLVTTGACRFFDGW